MFCQNGNKQKDFDSHNPKNSIEMRVELKREREALSALISVINERRGERHWWNKGERPVTVNPHH